MNIRKNGKREQNELAELSAFAAESFSGFATIKLFNNSLEEGRRFNAIANNYYSFRNRTNRLFAIGYENFCETKIRLVLIRSSCKRRFGKKFLRFYAKL